MKFLVGRMDGTPESGFAPGSIQPKRDVPVTRDFDHSNVVGSAEITVEGSEVYATITSDPAILERVAGVSLSLYPALGGRAEEASEFPRFIGRVFTKFEVYEVSLCAKPNVDPHIPPIKVNL